MKRKLTLQLSEQIVEQLKAAAERQGASRTTIVEAALQSFLNAETEKTDDSLLRRLDAMSGQLERLERDLKITNEVVALHARYHLTVSPVLPRSEHRAACVLGLERFDEFAAQVAGRIHRGTPLIRETMDRLSATSPDACTEEPEDGEPLGAAPAANDQNADRSDGIEIRPELPAAAMEGGSNGGFPGDDRGASG